jgi:RNA polymerase sigma-70 factor (ECF subfamily)
MLSGGSAQALTAWGAGMTEDADITHDKARRFRDAALPYLDDVYTLARYLMRNAVDAEDAAQECYLRALRHFDLYRGPAMKPWLLAILRNVCNAEFARRGTRETPDGGAAAEALDGPSAEPALLWQHSASTPEHALLQRQDGDAMRRLIAALPHQFREVIVLREINELSYQQIAEVTGVPVGTVMSRLARARTMLRAAWTAADGSMP